MKTKLFFLENNDSTAFIFHFKVFLPFLSNKKKNPVLDENLKLMGTYKNYSIDNRPLGGEVGVGIFKKIPFFT